ncbi:peptide deformylase [bacterium]|jgi:peptide deformylase|nr:peptide deformylase [bacterium]MBT4649248.1 peptide deformylase [bacterium]
MLKVIKYPNTILRKTAKPIVDFNDTLAKIATDMAEVMFADKGVGLAGPQVGIQQKIILAGNRKNHDYQAYINPKITFSSKSTEIGEEGCLSLPKIFGLVTRAKKIRVKYQDLTGKVHKEKFKGFPAIILQHEIDHLNGVLFIDRATEITQGQDILDQLKEKK